MGQTDYVEDQGIGGHPNPALSIRPPQELVTIMFKDCRPEDTLLAVTDRTGHHAVMTSDTGGESVQKGMEVLDHPLKFLEGVISLPCSFSNHFVDDILSGG